MDIDIISKLETESARITEFEHILSKGLMQPFNNMNSAPRKIIQASQLDQVIPVVAAEPALVQTGYEDEFGRHCTSFITADDDYQVVAKISKFPLYPNHNYILVLKSMTRNYYTVIERTMATHTTEIYGYLKDNEYLDTLQPMSNIPKDDVISKSKAFSEYGNRQDGVNLNTAYMTICSTTEDGMVISEGGAKKMGSPSFKNFNIPINDNDIPLNLYSGGDENLYKSIPNIGEYTNNGLLCGIRRESKDKNLFCLSWDRLKDIMISDEKYIANGQVIDINIYCNNPAALDESGYNGQLKSIYDDQMEYSRNIADQLKYIVEDSYIESSYELKKLYSTHSMIAEGRRFVDKKPFSNILLNILVMEVRPLEIGDKVSDRYGGKGVISEIIPDSEMPIMDNGDPLEFIINASGPVGRENPGQLIELSLNFIGRHVLNRGAFLHDTDEFIELYLEFIELIVPSQYKFIRGVLDKLDDDAKYTFIDSLADGIVLSIKPITESIDIDKLCEIYTRFKWLSPSKVLSPIRDSSGSIRYTESRRPLVCGKKYIYRLKQHAEDKESTTSLSPTNIRNEPSKSTSSSEYRTPYAKTPVRVGAMETGNLLHFLNIFPVVNNLMIHSTSPKARRSTEELLTGNPFDVNIEITEEATSRNVEVLNAYLKTMGLRIVFKKMDDTHRVPIKFIPFKGANKPIDGDRTPIGFLPFKGCNKPIGGDRIPVMIVTEDFDDDEYEDLIVEDRVPIKFIKEE